MEILSIIIAAIIGFLIGNSQKSQRKAQFEREQDRMDAEFKARHVRNGRIAYERQFLLVQRESYLRSIVDTNMKYKQTHGCIYEDVNKAMAEYDSRHVRKWYQAGMVPPTYANNINYYNDKNELSLWKD